MIMMCEKKSAMKAGFLLVSFLFVLLLVHFVGISRLTPESIRNIVLSFGWWGPVVYVVMYTIRPLLLFPAILLTLAGGLAFGPWWGTFYVVLGGVMGACLCFTIARLLGRDKMQKYIGKFSQLQLFESQIAQNGFRTMLIMRIVPIFPYDPVSYLAGLSKIRFWDYTAATALGMIPGAFAYNVLGYSLTDVFSSTFLLALLFVVVVMCTPLLYHFVKQRRV
ncbi:TVP38/TMEM64 family protein [Pelosinus sp. UFO1]|uniref:TVP38/TMEM64 family protein n=1 Tax=Pelosinus sp. UFO1 TaxID=484770 RepID=UPI0004D0B5A2|nr:TVP38/TMEM64 family protein [Pelosinus sp. UFO1]AIF50950.1 SNARE associated protein [Pelosinus sp. UFO1]